jgi:hypothetical protein
MHFGDNDITLQCEVVLTTTGYHCRHINSSLSKCSYNLFCLLHTGLAYCHLTVVLSALERVHGVMDVTHHSVYIIAIRMMVLLSCRDC